MQVKLTRVFRTTTRKDGSPLVGSNGLPYTILRIQTNEHGAAWLSGFENESTKAWKEGDTVEIEIEKNGEYLNFSTPKTQRSGLDPKFVRDVLAELHAIRVKQDIVDKKLNAIWDKLNPKDEPPMPNFDARLTDEDIAALSREEVGPEDINF